VRPAKLAMLTGESPVVVKVGQPLSQYQRMK